MKYRFINRLLNARGTESKRRRIKKNDYTNNTNSTSTFRILEQPRHQNGCERFESVARENIYTRILREQKWRVSIYVSLWINQLRFVIRRWNNKIPYRLQTRFEIRIHEKKIISPVYTRNQRLEKHIEHSKARYVAPTFSKLDFSSIETTMRWVILDLWRDPFRRLGESSKMFLSLSLSSVHFLLSFVEIII